MQKLIVVTAFMLTFLSFMAVVIVQGLITRRLKKLNNGQESPLISRNGKEANEHNSKFSSFLAEIDEETDLMLKNYKIWNRRLINIGIVLFFISFLIVIGT